MRNLLISVVLVMSIGFACTNANHPDPADVIEDPSAGQTSFQSATSSCEFVETDWGETGTVPLQVEKTVTGLEVPWGIAFLPNGDWLVTERPGRVRLVRGGELVAQPVIEISTGESSEGGLLGIAVPPNFSENNYFYVYYTSSQNEQTNRVERFVLSPDHTSAISDRIVLDQIPSAAVHEGGRIKFGPDGMLYVSTGDARNPENAQDMSSLNGKLLRLDPDGNIPSDNPFPGSPIFASGIRNLEAFDWADSQTLLVADHGPTGDLGLSGRDEVSFVSGGENLGWPLITGCEKQDGLITPVLSWADATPPGGGIVYHGNNIPEFDGSFLIAVLGSGENAAHQLHQIIFDLNSRSLISHEVYLKNQFGRLRDVVQSPDGTLYVTTSNCDSRGTCPDEGDAILKITRG